MGGKGLARVHPKGKRVPPGLWDVAMTEAVRIATLDVRAHEPNDASCFAPAREELWTA